MDSKKTIAVILGLVALAALIFLIVWLTAGTPPALEPPVNEAPGGN